MKPCIIHPCGTIETTYIGPRTHIHAYHGARLCAILEGRVK